MDDEPERMDPRCDAGMLWMEYCNNGEYIRATDYDALAAKLSEVTDDCDDLQIALASARKQLERYIAEEEARMAHLENHIEGVAKDTHKIMVDLANPMDDPRVLALVEALRDMTALAIQLGAIDLETRDALAALSALEENK